MVEFLYMYMKLFTYTRIGILPCTCMVIFLYIGMVFWLHVHSCFPIPCIGFFLYIGMAKLPCMYRISRFLQNLESVPAGRHRADCVMLRTQRSKFHSHFSVTGWYSNPVRQIKELRRYQLRHGWALKREPWSADHMRPTGGAQFPSESELGRFARQVKRNEFHRPFQINMTTKAVKSCTKFTSSISSELTVIKLTSQMIVNRFPRTPQFEMEPILFVSEDFYPLLLNSLPIHGLQNCYT